MALLHGDRFYRGNKDRVGRAGVDQSLGCREFAFPGNQLRLAPGDERAVGARDQHGVGREQRADRGQIRVGQRAIEGRAGHADGDVCGGAHG